MRLPGYGYRPRIGNVMEKSVHGFEKQRLRVVIRGAVQGVGFRPFVYRLATAMALPGWVSNSAQGVFVEVEGPPEALHAFLLRLEGERPPRASIQSLESSFLAPLGLESFEIRPSDGTGERTVLILPDIATCADCLREIFDPADRRHLYPFTNCTNCGPRFSIIQSLPYDRPNTTMARFAMCEACAAEYENPADRRFHAQPNACPTCGPHVELWNAAGTPLCAHGRAMADAAQAVRDGRVLALKGLGGFHLLADARNDEAISRLRSRKHREEKPLAIMAPCLEWVQAHCEISPLERRLLLSPESPIVLLRRRHDPDEKAGAVAPSVAPGNPDLGVMLPYTPLHHILLKSLNSPVVATSGNLTDEPICTDEREAVLRLSGIADLFLVHDRPIARHVDDSVARVILGRELVLRRARGYAPLPIHVGRPLPPVLAVGAHLKSSVAISNRTEVFVSQHIGDLETAQAFDAFRRVCDDLTRLYDLKPSAVACDSHPDYLSTRHATAVGLPVIRVQHHHAHVLACMAENGLSAPVLGVSWDGTGYGLDRTVWGGEFLRITDTGFDRVAHLRPFPLPGGDRAIKEPRRAAVGLLYEMLGSEILTREDLEPLRSFSPQDRRLLGQALAHRINAPLTSSAGRLFDAAAAILGLRLRVRFEGQAAMELEWAAHAVATDESYPFRFAPKGGSMTLDWEPTIRSLLADVGGAAPVAVMAARFHNTLAEMIVAVAAREGVRQIALSGGCFQNRYLTERAVRRLTQAGYSPHWHQRIPPNDGGIALGQIVAAAQGKE
jgi:hydrogenase maturation protein HypF